MFCTSKEQETCEVEKRGCEGCYYNKDGDYMNEEITVGLGFVIPLNKILDKLVNGNIRAEIGNITVKYIGRDDKKEVFEIVRDSCEWRRYT